MRRRSILALLSCATAGCTGVPSERGAAVAGPESQAARTSCEARLATHELITMRDVATCERDLALPQEQATQPGLASMYKALWQDKIAPYARVDRGELTKEAADRRIAIEADNWLTNIQSMTRL